MNLRQGITLAVLGTLVGLAAWAQWPSGAARLGAVSRWAVDSQSCADVCQPSACVAAFRKETSWFAATSGGGPRILDATSTPERVTPGWTTRAQSLPDFELTPARDAVCYTAAAPTFLAAQVSLAGDRIPGGPPAVGVVRLGKRAGGAPTAGDGTGPEGTFRTSGNRPFNVSLLSYTLLQTGDCVGVLLESRGADARLRVDRLDVVGRQAYLYSSPCDDVTGSRDCACE